MQKWKEDKCNTFINVERRAHNNSHPPNRACGVMSVNHACLRDYFSCKFQRRSPGMSLIYQHIHACKAICRLFDSSSVLRIIYTARQKRACTYAVCTKTFDNQLTLLLTARHVNTIYLYIPTVIPTPRQ